MFCVAVEKSKSPEKNPLKPSSQQEPKLIMRHVTPIARSETGPNLEEGGECFPHFRSHLQDPYYLWSAWLLTGLLKKFLAYLSQLQNFKF